MSEFDTQDRQQVDDSIAPDRFVASSRLHRLSQTSVWSRSDGIDVPMPVLLDLRLHDTTTGRDVFRFEGTVDLVDGEPAMTRFVADAAGGLDLVRLQREFRWATPVDVVTRFGPKSHC